MKKAPDRVLSLHRKTEKEREPTLTGNGAVTLFTYHLIGLLESRRGKALNGGTYTVSSSSKMETIDPKHFLPGG